MASDPSIYDLLAATLIYPNGGFEETLEQCERAVATADSDFGAQLRDWVERMRGLSPQEREEVYARTFDMSPKCTLELGWHVFGETYDRGTFLVWMRGQLRRFSLAESTDLPDHARHVLPVLGRMESEDADKFSQACVQPAMETICEGLDKTDSPYEPFIGAICTWLESHHGAPQRDSIPLSILSEQHEELLRVEDM
jgi:nitrate reductase delta subunit